MLDSEFVVHKVCKEINYSTSADTITDSDIEIKPVIIYVHI